MRDTFEPLLFLVLITLFVTALVVGIVGGGNAYQCRAWRTATGDQTKLIAFDCYVQKDGRWVSLDSYVKMHNLKIEEAKR